VTFNVFVRILVSNGFVLARQGNRGEVNGEVRLVTVAAHRMTDDIKPGTLGSMIRQSGLPKNLFR
jgi:predicted RNA binding protein YcfA (HicA-like mRNA interferase family)